MTLADHRRSTYQKGSIKTRLRWNWSYIAASISVGALFAVIACWAFVIATN